jgi:carbon storage regulator
MLILSRKTNESIVIDGRIRVKIVRVEGDVVKLGVEAPADVPVHRQEVYEEIQRNNQEALTQGRPTLPRLPKPAGSAGQKPSKDEQVGGTACALL